MISVLNGESKGFRSARPAEGTAGWVLVGKARLLS